MTKKIKISKERVIIANENDHGVGKLIEKNMKES